MTSRASSFFSGFTPASECLRSRSRQTSERELESRSGVSSSSGCFLAFVFWKEMLCPSAGFSVSTVRTSPLLEKKKKRMRGRKEKKKNRRPEQANKLARVQGLLIVWKMSYLAREDCAAHMNKPTNDNNADASATQTLYLCLFFFVCCFFSFCKEWSNIRHYTVTPIKTNTVGFTLCCTVF